MLQANYSTLWQDFISPFCATWSLSTWTRWRNCWMKLSSENIQSFCQSTSAHYRLTRVKFAPSRRQPPAVMKRPRSLNLFIPGNSCKLNASIDVIVWAIWSSCYYYSCRRPLVERLQYFKCTYLVVRRAVCHQLNPVFGLSIVFFLTCKLIEVTMTLYRQIDLIFSGQHSISFTMNMSIIPDIIVIFFLLHAADFVHIQVVIDDMLRLYLVTFIFSSFYF